MTAHVVVAKVSWNPAVGRCRPRVPRGRLRLGRPEVRSGARACVATAFWSARACQRNCGRLPAKVDVEGCRATCRSERDAAEAACRGSPTRAPSPVRTATLGAPTGSAPAVVKPDDRGSPAAADVKGPGDMRCLLACDRGARRVEAACGLRRARRSAAGLGRGSRPAAAVVPRISRCCSTTPSRPSSQPRTRAPRRSGRDRSASGSAGPAPTVTVTQTRHAFTFGFPIDFREFANAPDDLAFYGEHRASRTRTSSSPRRASSGASSSRRPASFFFDLADDELAWARDARLRGEGPHAALGERAAVLDRERHSRLALAQFPSATLTPAEQEHAPRISCAAASRRRSARYRGRIDVWDVTNETLNLFTQWFIAAPRTRHRERHVRVDARDRSGRQLVFNEWITRGVHGLAGPSAADVRDRVAALRAAGVPIDAIGQQAHFVPGHRLRRRHGRPLAADAHRRLRGRRSTRSPRPGLPIHITETNVIAPDEPEARAAQAEALMRLWWGHPAVEQIVFWALWNKVAARS